jgi:hypothetical protein
MGPDTTFEWNKDYYLFDGPNLQRISGSGGNVFAKDNVLYGINEDEITLLRYPRGLSSENGVENIFRLGIPCSIAPGAFSNTRVTRFQQYANNVTLQEGSFRQAE